MAYSKEQWNKAKGLFEAGKPLEYIVLETGIAKGTISGKSKIEKWEKNKTEQLKDDIIELEKQNRTISEQNRTISERIAKLEDYQIEVIKELVEDPTKSKSIIFGGLNLGAIRATQQLQRNTKKEMIKIKEGFGNGVSKEYLEEVELELNANDIKANIETLVKAGQGLGVIEKDGTNLTVNTQNNLQTNEIKTIDDIYGG